MNSRILLIVATAVLAIAAAAFLLIDRGGPAAEPVSLGDLSSRPTLGAADAPVQVALFEDFRCPHCATFTEEVMPRVESEFVEPGVASVTFLHFPVLGPASERAAVAATCVARQAEDAFWEVETALMRSQDRIAEDAGLRDVIRSYAPGLDEAAFEACFQGDEALEVVRADAALAGELGLRGTPSVLVDGVQVDPTWSAVSAAIREAAAE